MSPPTMHGVLVLLAITMTTAARQQVVSPPPDREKLSVELAAYEAALGELVAGLQLERLARIQAPSAVGEAGEEETPGAANRRDVYDFYLNKYLDGLQRRRSHPLRVRGASLSLRDIIGADDIASTKMATDKMATDKMATEISLANRRSKRQFDSISFGSDFDAIGKRGFDSIGESSDFGGLIGKRQFDSIGASSDFGGLQKRSLEKRSFDTIGHSSDFGKLGKRTFDSIGGQSDFGKLGKRTFDSIGTHSTFGGLGKRSFDSIGDMSDLGGFNAGGWGHWYNSLSQQKRLKRDTRAAEQQSDDGGSTPVTGYSKQPMDKEGENVSKDDIRGLLANVEENLRIKGLNRESLAVIKKHVEEMKPKFTANTEA